MKKNYIIWSLIFYSSIGMLITGIVGPVMPIFFNEIGFPVAESGTLIAVAGFTSAILSIFFGNLSERYDRRILFLISGIPLSLLPLGYVWATRTSDFLILRILEGIAGPLVGVAASAMLMDLAAQSDNKGSILGAFRTLRSMMFVIGPTVGGVFISLFATRNIFFLEAGLELSAFLAVILAVKSVPKVAPKKVKIFSLPALLKNKVVLSLLGLLMLDFMNFQSLLFIFALSGEQIGLDSSVIGALITVESLAYAVLQYPVGKLTDKGKIIPILSISVILHGPLIYLLTFCQGTLSLGIVMALIGCASAPAFLAVMILVSDEAGEETGIAMGMIGSIVYLATAVGPFFTAMLASLDLRMGFLVPVFSSALAIPLVLVVIRWHRNRSVPVVAAQSDSVSG